MNKRQFLILEATLVVIVVLLCINLFSNGQLMKSFSSSKETTGLVEPKEEEIEKVEIATDVIAEEDKSEEEISVAEDDTVKDEPNVFSRFPGAKSLESVMCQINPLDGDTYRQRQNNFEKIDIFVQEEVVISPLSDCFPEKTVDISIYETKSIITILNEEREEEEIQLFMPYNLYRKDEEIILEGVDRDTRKYYEYHFQNENWYVYGGENVDVPNEEKDFIFLTFCNGTYTLKGNELTFWNFLSKEVTGEIPEPAEPKDVVLCKNGYGCTVDFEGYYYGLPYIDKNGNIINLLITAESEIWSKSNPNDIFINDIDYNIIASNVKKIIDPNDYGSSERIVYQTKAGNYKMAIVSDEGNLHKVIDLNEETVSKVQFVTWGGFSGATGNSWIYALDVMYDVDGYGKVCNSFYDIKNDIILNESTKRLESLIEGEFSVSEFKERYPKVIQEIKKFE